MRPRTSTSGFILNSRDPSSFVSLLDKFVMTIMVTILICSLGCRPSDTWQIIDSRLEVSENPDSENQGTLTITFDRPMKLLESSSTGITFTHPGLDSASYRVESGDRPHEWKVILLSGFDSFLPRGEKPDGSRTRLEVDLDRLPISPDLNDQGKRKSGLTAITPSPVKPALLVGARWIDSDGSSTVNQEDLLVLEWDRQVETGIDRHPPGEAFNGPNDPVSYTHLTLPTILLV